MAKTCIVSPLYALRRPSKRESSSKLYFSQCFPKRTWQMNSILLNQIEYLRENKSEQPTQFYVFLSHNFTALFELSQIKFKIKHLYTNCRMSFSKREICFRKERQLSYNGISAVFIMFYCLALVVFAIKRKLRKSKFRTETPQNQLRYYQMPTCKNTEQTKDKALSLSLYISK